MSAVWFSGFRVDYASAHERPRLPHLSECRRSPGTVDVPAVDPHDLVGGKSECPTRICESVVIELVVDEAVTTDRSP